MKPTLLLRSLVLGLTAFVAFLTSPPAPAAAQRSLYADPKAGSKGDLITIVLAERTAAQRESGWQNQSNATTGGSGEVSGANDLSGRFALDATFNKESLSRNESVQSDLLHGTITAQIVGTDSTGNMIVSGERRMNVNGETHLMRVKGMVRPMDVRYDNTVYSYQIANADIEYRRDGFGSKWFKPGLAARLGALAVLGAAIFGAMQQ